MTPETALNARPVAGRLAFLREPCLYPDVHRWFLALAAVDVVLTAIVLSLGGQEANLVPRAVLARAGLAGMVALKTASVVCILLACEFVGRKREPIGRRLALAATAANSIAAAMGGAYLTIFSAQAYL